MYSVSQEVIPLKKCRFIFKILVSVPYWVLFAVWMSDCVQIPNEPTQIPVFFVLTSVVFFTLWLLLLSVFQFNLVLKMWGLISFLIALITLPAIAMSICCGNQVVGLCLAAAAILCVLHGLLSLSLPPVYIPPPPPEILRDTTSRPPTAPDYVQTTTQQLKDSGTLFLYIPLKGGPSVKMNSFSDVRNIPRQGTSTTPAGEEEVPAERKMSKMARVMFQVERSSAKIMSKMYNKNKK